MELERMRQEQERNQQLGGGGGIGVIPSPPTNGGMMGPGMNNDGLGPGGGILPGDGHGGQMMLDGEESTAVTLSRKYGYAIMALSVVVLAVLMVGIDHTSNDDRSGPQLRRRYLLQVATIFCCNSSNSTMSQAATASAAAGAAGAGLPGQQYDTYSIYSYKGGAAIVGPGGHHGGVGTLGGMDTLGGASLRTETLKSTRSMASRASPQYRVSDIDPEFARRFDRDAHHQY